MAGKLNLNFITKNSKGVSHSCPCRLFREHWVINLPRAKFKGSTARLKSCRSESVKKFGLAIFQRFMGDLPQRNAISML